MTYHEKFEALLEEIAIKRALTPKNRITKIIFRRTEDWVEFDDKCKLISKLQDDYGLLKVTDIFQDIEDADPTVKIDLYEHHEAIAAVAVEVDNKFDTFYASHLLKKKTLPVSLSWLNLLSVLDVVLSIDEKLQIAGNPMVLIPVFPNRIRFEELFPANTPGTRNEYSVRTWESLKYLRDKGFIEIVKTDKRLDAWNAEVTIKVTGVAAFDIFRKEVGDEYDKRIEKHKQGNDENKQQVVSANTEPEASLSQGASEVVYTITYGADLRIVMNGQFEIGRPNFDNENANVFELLFDEPNMKKTKKQIEEKLEKPLTKSLHKIVENLGFTKDLKKAFFNVSETSIEFHNPVTRKRLDSLNISVIRL